MNPILYEALEQADQRISQALGRAAPAKSRLSPRGTIFNPAPLALNLNGEELAANIVLEGSWFSQVTADNGYLNFVLSQDWYGAAVEQLPIQKEKKPVPPVAAEYPAAIHPMDWWFLTILKGKKPAPELAARQDRENPGWLVRYTIQRLKELEERSAETIRWTEGERRLMRLLAQDAEKEKPRRQAAMLVELAELVWEIAPQNLPKPLNCYCQRVLENFFSA